MTGSSFSRVYVEEQALTYPVAKAILKRVGGLPRVMISDYQEVFSRPGMSFSAQKRSPALILAVKHGNFLYRGNETINSWEQEEVFYNDIIRNCIYDCEYCFLQGMHASAHAVVFVNSEEYLEAVRVEASQRERLNLSVSYLSDMLGFEPIVPYTRMWIEFASTVPNVDIEVRTKSDNYPLLHTTNPVPNVVFVWSLAPERIASSIEHGTASFKNRLFAARNAIHRGFRTRICFDPVVTVEGWERLYEDSVQETFRRLPADAVELVSVGSLRMNREQLARLRRQRPGSADMYLGMRPGASPSRSLMQYEHGLRARIRDVLGAALTRHLPADRIRFVGI